MKLCVYDLLALSAPVSKWNEPAGCEGMFGEAPMDGNGASHGSRNYLLGAVKYNLLRVVDGGYQGRGLHKGRPRARTRIAGRD